MKLLWIGVDGFSFRMVERTKNRFLSDLINRSQSGISESVLTDRPIPLTGPNWATLYTGVTPAVHGISDGGWLLENLKYQDIKVNTVFDLIDDHLTQALMTLPLTYPAFPVNGWMVSGFPTPKSLKDCYFPSEIEGYFPDGFKISYAKCTKKMSWNSIQDLKTKTALKNTFHQIALDHINVFKAAQQDRNTDVAFVGLTYIDRMNHLFTQKEEGLADAYRETYQWIEDLIKFCNPENLIICADHGFEEEKREHDLFGFYLIQAKNYPSGRKDIPITNIAPTVLEILDIDEKLGVPVEREKTKIKPRRLWEMQQRLRALGYI